MSRWDLTGIFWDDYVAPRVPVVKEKRTPPEPVWLKPDYLPNLKEARAHRFDLMTDRELIDAWHAKDRFVWDTEFYPNYALIGAKSTLTGKILIHEMHRGQPFPERDRLIWMLRNFCFVGFNDTLFDAPMVHATLAGFSTDKLVQCVEAIIQGGESGFGMRPQEFYKEYKLAKDVFPINNIDLIELTPLGPGLKICAGRFHAARMADLPFVPGTELTDDQKTILRWYWANDLENTHGLYKQHKTAIELRETLTAEYKVDVRSKSDPQIAEQVIRSEIRKINRGTRIERAEIVPGRWFRFQPPAYLDYKTETMQWVLNFIRRQKFVVNAYGSPVMPSELEGLDIPIGKATYRMGIGGLHSQEKRTIHLAGDEYEITDNDVTSYYPALILQQGMFPPNVGPAFLQVFKRIVDRRIAAKRAGDKATAETLKIVVNGTFGKTGERGGYSVVYYPEMMIQVTLSGQLSLLMLIEWLELAGIEVISANTDGVTVKCPRHLVDKKNAIIKEWERVTELELESKEFKALYSRDVNNYVAILAEPDKKEPTAFKYAKTVGAYRKTIDVYPLKWNPTCEICSEAVILYLANGTPVDETIRACTDVRKFIEVRRVTGGACKDGEYLGKAIRWYYAKGEDKPIINAKNGHDVPRSKGARPCMTLPTSMPDDIDYDYYSERAMGMIDDFYPKKKKVEEKEAA